MLITNRISLLSMPVGRIAVVKNEMQERDQSQAIHCIIDIPMPIHLRGVRHRVAEKSGATRLRNPNTIMLILLSDRG